MITWLDIEKLLYTLYWGGMAFFVVAAVMTIFLLVKEEKWRAPLLVLAVVGIPGMFYLYPRIYLATTPKPTAEQQAKIAKYNQAKAIFDERCKTAGEQIYRTASDVEGITLLNIYPEVRSSSTYNPYSDPMWPDATLKEAWGGEYYIASFLGWMKKHDHGTDMLWRPSLDAPTLRYKGIVTVTKNYDFIDVLKNNSQIIRYRQNLTEENDNKLFLKEFINDSSRYAVLYEPIVNNHDRKYWVAGAKVRIIDQKKQEIMAEKTWYAFEPGQGRTSGGVRQLPWRFAITCPEDGSDRSPISKFVVNVIKPKQGEQNESGKIKIY